MFGKIWWRAIWIARECRLMYTYGEHELLALLENLTPEVTRMIEAQGLNPGALRDEVEQLVQRLVPIRRAERDPYGEDVYIENHAWALADHKDFPPEYLLLAMASPLGCGPQEGLVTEAAKFLNARGLTPKVIRAGIRSDALDLPERPPFVPTAQTTWLIDGWKDAVANFRFVHSFALHASEFYQLLSKLRHEGEWAMAGHLYETLAASTMLEYRADPQRWSVVNSARYLVMAALCLRKAGDDGRARLVAERAIYELQQIHTDGRPNPQTLAHPIDVAFAFEMMGDAALCIDPSLAKSYWLRAMEEFQYIDPTTQCAEWNEPWIHGWYLEQVHRFFLSGDPGDFGSDGAARVADKMAQWLRA